MGLGARSRFLVLVNSPLLFGEGLADMCSRLRRARHWQNYHYQLRVHVVLQVT